MRALLLYVVHKRYWKHCGQESVYLQIGLTASNDCLKFNDVVSALSSVSHIELRGGSSVVIN